MKNTCPRCNVTDMNEGERAVGYCFWCTLRDVSQRQRDAVIPKQKLRIGWSCSRGHHHRWKWTSWLCCKIHQLQTFLSP